MATKASIIVPQTADNARIVAKTVATELANEYGGSTMLEGEGYYDSNGLLEYEDNITVYTVSGEVNEERVREIAEWVEGEIDDETVMFTFEEVDVRFT